MEYHEILLRPLDPSTSHPVSRRTSSSVASGVAWVVPCCRLHVSGFGPALPSHDGIHEGPGFLAGPLLAWETASAAVSCNIYSMCDLGSTADSGVEVCGFGLSLGLCWVMEVDLHEEAVWGFA